MHLQHKPFSGCRASRSTRGTPGTPCLVPKAVASDRTQPAWTGETLLSKAVNWAINTPAIYSIMKVAAKNVIKSGAIKKGVPWEEHVASKQATFAQLEQLKAQIEDPNIQYPEYYLQPFHAYDKGNLDWTAAFEVDPASYAMAIRTFKTEELTPEAAWAKLRGRITDAIKACIATNNLTQPKVILDIGCSTGMSTRWLADHFPDAQVSGLDLSPHFLAVATQYELERPGGPRITYRHGLAEATQLPDHSVDLLSMQFVIHECPGPVIESFCKEAARVIKPGGVLCFVDNDPQSSTIQNLPPVLFTLMKSTEPHSDSYYSFDVEAAMQRHGFKAVHTVETDHRHRTVLGVAA